jgi:pyruvate/2-oxoglutarate dehydrogenase complex dihydrolipoamide acyltransferase (E2) component
MAHEVIMPALGMTQTTGLIVSWLKAAGDPVKVGDPLMEVETDKTTMEVAAQAGGFLTEIRYPVGAEVPVGEVIALISTEKAATQAPNKLERSAPAVAPTAEAARVAPAQARSATPFPMQAIARTSAALASQGGRILISPKARRLAAQRGLNIQDLPAMGLPQPYHVADLDRIPATAGAAPLSPAIAAVSEYEAIAVAEPVLALASWLSETLDRPVDMGIIWAAFAGASLGAASARVRVETTLRAMDFLVGPRVGLASLSPTSVGAEPDIVVRDFTRSHVSRVRNGSVPRRILTLTTGVREGAICATLHVDDALMSAVEATAFLEAFTRRIEDPLIHLL